MATQPSDAGKDIDSDLIQITVYLRTFLSSDGKANNTNIANGDKALHLNSVRSVQRLQNDTESERFPL